MIKLGTLALWNIARKSKTINASDRTLALIKKHAPEQFEKLISASMPTFDYRKIL